MTKQLRPYQKKCIDVILDNIDKGIKKQAICLPTGAGKTFMSAELIKILLSKGQRILFLVANSPLVKQTYDEFMQNDIYSGVIKAGMNKYENAYAKVQIMMLQTYIARIDKLDIKPFDTIIMDECDYCWSGSMIKKVFEKFPNANFIGISATIIDDKGYLLDGFDYYYNEITVKFLQEQGYLSVDKNYVPLTPDLKNVRVMNTGDFNEDDLNEACNKSYIIDDIVKSYKKVDCGYQGIVFAINIDHAERLAKAFNMAGIKAAVIHSKMKKFLVDYWLNQHKNKKVQLLISIGMTIRGYNDVDIIDVICARPTNSERLLWQALGRGARIDNQQKHFFRHFDFGGNIERFGLFSEPRIYTKNNEPKKERNYPVLICPNCFSVIVARNGQRCPECDFIIKAQQEKRERQIIETQRAEKVIEIQSEYNAGGIISKLTDLLGHNGNTFYYTKLLPLRPMNVDIEVFNAEVSRLVSYGKRKGYKPYYVLYKLRDKMSLIGG